MNIEKFEAAVSALGFQHNGMTWRYSRGSCACGVRFIIAYVCRIGDYGETRKGFELTIHRWGQDGLTGEEIDSVQHGVYKTPLAVFKAVVAEL